MFQQYFDELSTVLSEADGKLGEATNPLHSDGDSKVALLKEVGGLLSAGSDLAKQLDVEVRSAPPAGKRALQDRAAPLREELKRLAAAQASALEAAERESVLGGAGGSHAASGSRGRLADANARAQKQTEVIRGALEVAHDTEQVAIDITGELERNRETITNIRGHISDTAGSLGSARGLINSMQKREVQQKAILSVVAALLIGAIGAVSYFSFN